MPSLKQQTIDEFEILTALIPFCRKINLKSPREKRQLMGKIYQAYDVMRNEKEKRNDPD